MSKNKVLEICALLEERNALDVIALEMGPECSWASYFVIGTVGSRVHMQGLSATMKEILQDSGIKPGSSGKRSDENSWRIIDGGDIVVSLMDSDARNYYALEERWFESRIIFGSEADG